ncbi:MAG: DNA polymerase III, subunit gamma and tau [Candidatus Levybacteria bacterium RIFCSPLOWO2_01_FULL_36_13]|nr:MAG: DNA polymerase III, subunit gamma and tau [Candidatus Levybacteria bacterium RIFCSPHIGHO2_01_FULL_36_15b]OGH35399.1 MAG: DNA polymerase III, subunit gamma and tau [Candidatus Levybacteria bacterium RIFCSPLOWO2_01_FULL_36_13]
MVFYRTYRPQKISELDSADLRERLYSIFTKNFDTAHAYLFSGPKGLGKTSAARIVAKVINCEKHEKLKKAKLTEAEIEPDNKCWQCTSITSGTNFDVLEIDGASNRGIDEIRDLKEKINLLPGKAARKVYIIDEVHMLTSEAFNALLKTLEEPPAHAVFILCTTELHKVPQTIVSRCFRVDFKKATDEEIERSLLRIIKGESIKIEKQAISAIAKISDGSFRDAAKILEELSLTSGKKTITQDYVSEKFNTLGIELAIEQFINSLNTKDTKKGFEVVSKLAKQGIDFKFFIENLLEKFHLMLLGKLGVGPTLEDKFEISEIKTILELLAKAHSETKYAVLPQLPLELMIVEWSERAQSLEFRVQNSQGNQVAAGRLPSAGKLDSFYNDFINEVKVHNHLIAGVLRSCEIEQTNGSMQIIAISKFHKEKLEESKTFKILQDVAEALVGKKVKLDIILRPS